jgi:hypothetical protein
MWREACHLYFDHWSVAKQQQKNKNRKQMSESCKHLLDLSRMKNHLGWVYCLERVFWTLIFLCLFRKGSRIAQFRCPWNYAATHFSSLLAEQLLSSRYCDEHWEIKVEPHAQQLIVKCVCVCMCVCVKMMQCSVAGTVDRRGASLRVGKSLPLTLGAQMIETFLSRV